MISFIAYDSSSKNHSTQGYVEDGTPETRWNLTANHNINAWRFLARINYYDEWFDNEAGATFDDEFVVDLEAAYMINENIEVTVGGRNVFDEKGCKTDSCGGLAATELGLPYSQFTPWGFNGAFYYGRVTFNFNYPQARLSASTQGDADQRISIRPNATKTPL